MHYRKGKSTSKATIDECKDAEQFREHFGGAPIPQRDQSHLRHAHIELTSLWWITRFR